MAHDVKGILYDDATGLPKLPDGWIWKVTSTHDDWHDTDYITVAIKHPQTLYRFEFLGLKFGEYQDFFTYKNFYGIFTDPADLDKEARKVYTAYAEDAERKQAIRDIVGTYPPKSIVS